MKKIKTVKGKDKKAPAWWQKMKKPLQVVCNVLEWTVFLLLSVTFFVVLSPLLPTKKYIYTYVVATGSMEKTIMAGSVAFVKPAEVSKLRKGDIITFVSPKDQKATILHRIYDIKEKNKIKTFITKGDNNNAPDNWVVDGMRIKGRYLFSVPYIGHIGAFVKTPKGFVAVVVIPALILVFLQIKTIKQGIEEEVEKRTKKVLAKKANGKILKSVIILAFIFNVFGFWGASKYVQAVYASTSTISGIHFSIIDFIPPSIPTGLRYLSPDIACGGTTDSYSITADWNDSTAHGSKTIDHYEYESFNPPGGWTWGPVNVTASQLIGSFTAGEGTYGFRVRAVDSLGYKSDWSSVDFAGSCQATYSIPKPVVTIDESFGHKINGYECGIGSALSDDGIKIDVTNWKSGYTLQAHYKIGGGGYGGWFDLYDGIWGSGSLVVTGDNATFTVLNTGDSVPGAAGWEARVLDTSANPFPSVGVSEYIITTDSHSLACNGTVTMGYETAENAPQLGVGACPVITKDSSQNGGASSLQVLKWNEIAFATQYRVTGYRLNGSSWIPYGSPYTLLLTNPRISLTGGVVSYTTWATAEYTTAYYMEALDSSNNILANTSPQNPPFTCTFTVDRTAPTSTITTPANSGSGHTVPVDNTPVVNWNGTIGGTSNDSLSGINRVELSINRTDTSQYWNGSAWVVGTESNTRVVATGTTSWAYTLSDHPTGVIYVITSHAVDNAGNMENSYILVLENLEPQSPVVSPLATITLSADKKTVSFNIKNISGYQTLDYELRYMAYETEKGIVGNGIDITGQAEYQKDNLDLATCSNEVCTYDQDVKNFQLKIVLKDKDGKETVVESKL